jgi:ribosomal protein S18 acetylase RimI-like enzyme
VSARTDRLTAGGQDVLDRWPFWRANAGRFRLLDVWTTTSGAATAPAPAVALVERGGGTGLVGLGRPADLAALLAEVSGRAGPVDPTPARAVVSALLPRGTWDAVGTAARERLGLRPGRPWDWLTCTAAPPRHPDAGRVRDLGTGPAAAARAQEVLDRAYPEREARADDASRTWVGFDDGAGGLAGVLSALPLPGGVHLSAVAVDPAWRRRGVATAMTSEVTRRALVGTGLVHLGTWADNDAARALYLSLGYTVAAELENLHAAPRW